MTRRRLRGLFTALVADITAGAFARSAQSGRPIEPALLLALDEAANIAPLPNLDEIASTGPGQGVQLLTVLQNISQAADRWGRDRAETILANHRARLFCSGIGDRATLDYLRHTLGEEEIARFSTHRKGALQPGSRTISSDFRSLAPAHRVRQADPDVALLDLRAPRARVAAPAPLVLTPRAYAPSQPASPGLATPAPPRSPCACAAALGRLSLQPAVGPMSERSPRTPRASRRLRRPPSGLRHGRFSCGLPPGGQWRCASCLARFSPPPSGLRPPQGGSPRKLGSAPPVGGGFGLRQSHHHNHPQGGIHMNSINITGRLTADPELRSLPSGENGLQAAPRRRGPGPRPRDRLRQRDVLRQARARPPRASSPRAGSSRSPGVSPTTSGRPTRAQTPRLRGRRQRRVPRRPAR